MNDDYKRRYCPHCDDDTLVLRSTPYGFKYGCMNYTNPDIKCSVMQPAEQPAFERQAYQAPAGTGEPVEYTIESKIAQLQTREAVLRATESLDEFASHNGLASCAQIEQQLRDRIPGFGTVKNPKDLTQAERDVRADVLGEFLREGIKRMLRPLPYDKADRSQR